MVNGNISCNRWTGVSRRIQGVSGNEGNLAILSHDPEHGLRCRFRPVQHLPCPDIEDRAMAEAADGLSFKPAVAEPACPMGAAVRERVDPLFQV